MRVREDSSRHDAAAALRLPGPDYYEALRWIHRALRPAVYLEIGVLYGESLRIAEAPTVAIGIDPAPLADHAWSASTQVLPINSDQYFAHPPIPDISLAFIDGSHCFVDVLRDFLNVERHAAPDAVVLLHDTIPLDETTASPVRASEFHTGDVWKMLAYFALCRPELEVVTIPAAPSGLTMARWLRRQRRGDSLPHIVDAVAGLPWSRRGDHLVTIENSEAAVQRWLLRQ